MNVIGMFEAKTHLAEIIKRVENGEEICLTNRNKPVAMVVPIKDYKQKKKEEYFERLREMTKISPAISIEEVIDMRDEGRK